MGGEAGDLIWIRTLGAAAEESSGVAPKRTQDRFSSSDNLNSDLLNWED